MMTKLAFSTRRLRNAALATSAIAYSTLAGAQTVTDDQALNKLNFDLSAVDDKALGALTVGVGITIAFAVYRVGKRAANKI